MPDVTYLVCHNADQAPRIQLVRWNDLVPDGYRPIATVSDSGTVTWNVASPPEDDSVVLRALDALRPEPTFEGHPTERWWINDRTLTSHLFVRGPGTGDASLCGAVLTVSGAPTAFAGTRTCERCLSNVD